MSKREYRAVPPPSGELPIYRNGRMFIGYHIFEEHEVEAWFGLLSEAEAIEAEVYYEDEWYQVWTTSDGDRTFQAEVMGVNQVSDALVPKGETADYFLDMGRVDRFKMLQQIFTQVRNGRYSYREEPGGEPKHIQPSQKRERIVESDSGSPSRKQAKVAQCLGQLDMQHERDQDDEEPLPTFIKQEPLRSSISSAVPDPVPTTSKEQDIEQEQTAIAGGTITGQGANESTVDEVEYRSAKEKKHEAADATERDTLQKAMGDRDVILAISERWANTVGERYSMNVHQLLGGLWSARDPRNITAASAKLVDLLQLYRHGVEEIVLHERNNIEFATATGVTAGVLAAHKDALKQYEALLVDISGDVDVMASLIEVSESFASE